MKSSARSVAAYIQEAEPAHRPLLKTLRMLIAANAPRVSELMKYGHPHYEQAGSLFAVASQKHYVAFYVAEPDTLSAHREALAGFSLGKSCVRIRPNQTPPADVIALIVRDASARRRGPATASSNRSVPAAGRRRPARAGRGAR
jgi:uncharacterized protein YdhG (YjbR/CyaY superfamily)